MAKRGRPTDRPSKKKDTGYGMKQLRLGMKPIRKNWHFDEGKVQRSQITRIKKLADGRAFVDYPDGRKVIRIPDGTEIERKL